MADSAPISKSAKKNQKRKEKKKAKQGVAHIPPVTTSTVQEEVKKEESPPPPPPPAPVDPIAEVKRQIEEAKAAKDHERTQMLRQQLWVLQDTVALGRAGPGAPQLDTSVFTSPPKPTPDVKVTVATDSPAGKKLGKLQKKLQQIQELKERQAKGEHLEANQLAKIKTESEILDEIDILEDLLEQSQLK